MKKTFAIRTKNAILGQRIRLELIGLHGMRETDSDLADFVFCDIDTETPRGGELTLSQSGAASIPVPVPMGALFEAMNRRCAGISAIADERAALISGQKIKLTEIEFALFSLLLKSGGDFVPREEILRKIWPDGTDGGVINVYVHYLREKLEFSGEKIIISRRGGYAIDGRFLSKNDGNEESEYET